MDCTMIALYIVKTFEQKVGLKNSKTNIHQGDEERKYQELSSFTLSEELIPFGKWVFLAK